MAAPGTPSSSRARPIARHPHWHGAGLKQGAGCHRYAARVTGEGRPAAAASTAASGLRIASSAPYDRLRYIFVEGELSHPPGRDPAPHRDPAGQPAGRPGPERRSHRSERGVCSSTCAARVTSSPPCVSRWIEGTAAGPTDVTVRLSLGPAFPLGPVQGRGQQRRSDDDVVEMFRHADPLKLWAAPSRSPPSACARTSIASPSAIASLATSARACRATSTSTRASIARPRTSHSRSPSTSVRRSKVAFEGNLQKSAGTAQGRAHHARPRVVRRLRGLGSADAVQRYYQQHGHFFGAASRGRREPISAGVERVVFVRQRRPELKVRGIEFPPATDPWALNSWRTWCGPTLSIPGRDPAWAPGAMSRAAS